MAEKTITIDGTKYDLDKLSKAARQQVVNFQAANMEIQRLRLSLAMAQTARNAYGQALKAELAKS